MAPIDNVTCTPANISTEVSRDLGKDDLNALLYIVVTLLFYSMGIIIGIITYLKREQAEMEEDKMFDMYMQLKREPFNLQKKEQVQQVALFLKELEEKQAAREKIENWRAIELSRVQQDSHYTHHQPSHRQMTACPERLRTSVIVEDVHEHTATTTPDADWADNGGGTALLCSLTLGVCQPLITPESLKRMAFSGSSPSEKKTLINSQADLSLSLSLPLSGSSNIVTSGPLAVAQFLNNAAFSSEKIPRKSFLGSSFPGILNSDVVSRTGDIEMKEIIHNENTKDLYKSIIGAQRNHYDNLSSLAVNRRSPYKRSISMTAVSGGYTMFNDRSELYLEKEINDQKVDEILTLPSEREANFVNKSDSSLNGAISCDKTAENTPSNVEQEHCLLNMSNNLVEKGENSPQQQLDPLFPHFATVTPLEQSTASFTTTSCERPHLQLHKQHHKAHPAVARPKTFPTQNVFKFPRADVSLNVGGSSSDSTLPHDRHNTYTQLFDSWPKSVSQSIDITDVTRARKIGLDWKNKFGNKKLPPRSQPERRGALFFTQRSFQKDFDGFKSNTGQKHSKPHMFFPRQESVDSYNSRISDASEGMDSPLIQSGSDAGSCMNISIASSAGSSSMSPPVTNRQQSFVPRLIRSETLDTSKLIGK